MRDERVPALHLVPGVDRGERDLSTIEWFRHADKERWALSLITTESSANRGLHELEPFAEEIWELPDQMAGSAFPEFILGFIESRGIRLVQIVDSRLGFDLLPDMASLPQPPVVVAGMQAGESTDADYVRYAARRYGNLIDAFAAADERVAEEIAGHGIAPSRIEAIGSDDGAAAAIRRQAELCERVLAARSGTSRWRHEMVEAAAAATVTAPTPPLRFPREPRPEPTVSVGVPCFRHGLHLDECLRSVKQQFLKPAHIVVVDDGSEDPETIAALERWETDPAVTILRQPTNLGPSAARNRALELFDTSYGLWIDADDQLVPGALDTMVAKLEAAPEEVGFIYPHAKHIGNRRDYVEMPAYNLWLLMRHNICPSPCLFDLRLFGEDGVRYPEDMVVGHEDWDLILQLAERGVHGLHADGPTFLYRKQGFSRVHAVDYGPHDFHRDIEARHPALYLNGGEIKAEWAPALSIVLFDEAGPEYGWRGGDLEVVQDQTCGDFELLAGSDLGPAVRAVEADEASPDAWLQAALREARGRWVCVLAPEAAATLARPATVEQLLRSLRAEDEVAAVALGSAPDIARHTFAQMDEEERRSAQLSGVAFERTPGAWIPRIALSEAGSVLADLVLGLQAHGIVQWRLAAPPDPRAGDPEVVGEGMRELHRLDLNYRRRPDPPEAVAGRLISLLDPRLPGLTPGTVRRWEDLSTWTPPDTQPLCRHRQLDGPARLLSVDRKPPPGFEHEHTLGVTHVCAFPGTRRLVHRAGTFELSENQDELVEGLALGYIETERFPTCERLELCEMPETGDRVLIAGADDPLHGVAEPLALLGWIVPFENPPRGKLFHAEPWRAVTLRRTVDVDRGRHAYAVASSESGPGSTALGSVLTSSGPDLVALRRRDDGRLVTELAQPGRASRDPRRLVQWVTSAPSAAGADSHWSPSARARRLARHWPARRLSEDEGETLGWLRREVLPGSRPLFSTTHPVTGDQLVTCDPREAVELGYLPDGILGFILEASREGEADSNPYSVPWSG